MTMAAITAPPPVGERPAPFLFPFEQVGPAKEMLEATREALVALTNNHIACFEAMKTNFEGATAEAFNRAFAEAMDRVGQARLDLGNQVTALEQLRALATSLRETRSAGIAAWDSANRKHQAAIRGAR